MEIKVLVPVIRLLFQEARVHLIILVQEIEVMDLLIKIHWEWDFKAITRALDPVILVLVSLEVLQGLGHGVMVGMALTEEAGTKLQLGLMDPEKTVYKA
jgi:hypothetical protein